MPKTREIVFEKQDVKPVEFDSLYPIYRKDTDDAGREIFKVVEWRDRQKEIDSFADSCDMQLIVSRYMTGDVDIINQAHGYFIDCRDFPDNPQQTFEVARAAEAAFYRLSPEERVNYSDIIDFVVKMANAAVKEPQQPEKVDTEVKPDAES